MINKQTDSRVDIYFINKHIQGWNLKQHFTARIYNRKGLVTNKYEKGVNEPRTRTVGVSADCLLKAHVLSLPPSTAEKAQKTLKNPLLSKRCVFRRSPSHMQNHKLFFYSPLETSKPKHSALVPNFKKKQVPGHKWAVFPNFLSIINFSIKMVYINSFSQKRSI